MVPRSPGSLSAGGGGQARTAALEPGIQSSWVTARVKVKERQLASYNVTFKDSRDRELRIYPSSLRVGSSSVQSW